MPLSYDFIEKPPQVEIIDQFFSGGIEALSDAYAEALRLLDNGKTLDQTTEDIADDGPGPLRRLKPGDAQHFRQHWLDPDKPEHPWSGPDVDDVMREAYRDAVNAAREHDPPVPIETFWVFTSVKQVEMRVSETDTQVTVHVLIPKTDEIQFRGPRTGHPIRIYRPKGSGSSGAD